MKCYRVCSGVLAEFLIEYGARLGYVVGEIVCFPLRCNCVYYTSAHEQAGQTSRVVSEGSVKVACSGWIGDQDIFAWVYESRYAVDVPLKQRPVVVR
jgi:hypothetical protein